MTVFDRKDVKVVLSNARPSPGGRFYHHNSDIGTGALDRPRLRQAKRNRRDYPSRLIGQDGKSAWWSIVADDPKSLPLGFRRKTGRSNELGIAILHRCGKRGCDGGTRTTIFCERIKADHAGHTHDEHRE